MADIYKCVKGVKLNGTLFKPGTPFPAGDVGPDELQRLCKIGAVRIVGVVGLDETPSQKLVTPKATDAEDAPRDEGVKFEEFEQPPPPPHAGKWAFDPKKIATMELVQLQALIAEHDPKAVPPDSLGACIAHLSQDFTG